MSIYRNQAQRVIDHITAKMEINEEKLSELFNIDVERIEEQIKNGVEISGLNGYKMAGKIIDLWEKSNPDYASS